MPLFYNLNDVLKPQRAAQGLLSLRGQLEELPKKVLAPAFLIGTWNLREFDNKKYGHRMKESYLYIAEIISHFDIVALQEIRSDLHALKELKKILGPSWQYLVAPVTYGPSGNHERLAFMYDTRKIQFSGIAGNIVLPPIKQISGGFEPSPQLARTPYWAGFQIGNFKFILCTVHIIYGTSSATDPRRLQEIRSLLTFMNKRTRDKTLWSNNIILLGDFNIFNKTDQAYHILLENNFSIPSIMNDLPATNIGQTPKYFDQIAFSLEQKWPLENIEAGVINFYESVFKQTEQTKYVKELGEQYKSRYLDWRTYQMSDHLPLWVQMKIDFGERYLLSVAHPQEENQEQAQETLSQQEGGSSQQKMPAEDPSSDTISSSTQKEPVKEDPSLKRMHDQISSSEPAASASIQTEASQNLEHRDETHTVTKKINTIS